jgi:hypothetical protein
MMATGEAKIMTKDKLPPETKRALVGMIFWLLGGVCITAGFFYTLYVIFMAMRHGRHRW